MRIMLRKRVKIMAENILKSGDSQHDSHAAKHSHYGNIHNENLTPAIMSCFRGFHALAGNKKKSFSS